MTTELHVTVTAATVPVVAGHRFERPTEDCAEICSCGAAFFDGYNLQAVKVAHLEAWAEILAPVYPGQQSTRYGRTPV